MTNAIELNETNFDSEVKNSEKPVLVDFFATWCGPCKRQSPIVDELANDYSDKIGVGKFNVDDGGAIASDYGISSIPALLVFNEGKVVERLIGLHSKGQLESILQKYIN